MLCIRKLNWPLVWRLKMDIHIPTSSKDK
uniref:Uncharacterized protein n=1 Tax=Rhizophora mucronata TaxID=61149 RepID=A0A2P2NVL4_RHIMU